MEKEIKSLFNSHPAMSWQDYESKKLDDLDKFIRTCFNAEHYIFPETDKEINNEIERQRLSNKFRWETSGEGCLKVHAVFGENGLLWSDDTY